MAIASLFSDHHQAPPMEAANESLARDFRHDAHEAEQPADAVVSVIAKRQIAGSVVWMTLLAGLIGINMLVSLWTTLKIWNELNYMANELDMRNPVFPIMLVAAALPLVFKAIVVGISIAAIIAFRRYARTGTTDSLATGLNYQSWVFVAPLVLLVVIILSSLLIGFIRILRNRIHLLRLWPTRQPPTLRFPLPIGRSCEKLSGGAMFRCTCWPSDWYWSDWPDSYKSAV